MRPSLGLISLLLSTLASAGDFKAPTRELQDSRFHNNCNGVSADLSPLMPPIDNQLQSPWCNSFSTRAILEHNYREQLKGQRLSVVDVNAIGSTASPSPSKNLRPSLHEGSASLIFLSRIQSMGAVHLEPDYPFQQSLFDRDGTIRKLEAYYRDQSAYAQVPGGIQCRPEDEERTRLETTFTNLLGRLQSSTHEREFLEATQDDNGNFGLNPRTGANRRNLLPPFDLDYAEFQSGDSYIASLSERLRAGRPTILSVCAFQLDQTRSIGLAEVVPPAERGNCGAHALVAVGMRVEGGQCKVLIRNSWGKDWPRNGSSGMAWVSTRDLMRSLAGDPSPSMISIKPRANEEARPRNTVATKDSLYRGELRDQHFEGQGELVVSGGQRQTGRFESGRLVEGELVDAEGNQQVGRFKAGHLVEGDFIGVNGGKFSGKFDKGQFVEGTYEGPLSDGARYSGGWRGGSAQGRGRLKLANGEIHRGEFEDGQLNNGVILQPIPNRPRRFREFQVTNGEFFPGRYREVMDPNLAN